MSIFAVFCRQQTCLIKYKNVLKSILTCHKYKIILWICNLKLYNDYTKKLLIYNAKIYLLTILTNVRF